MELKLKNLTHIESWQKMGVDLPSFNYEAVKTQTHDNPQWVHFGIGNIFRGFVADLYQDLLDKNLVQTGLIAVNRSPELVQRILTPYDNLTLLVKMNSDKSLQKKVIASIVESYALGEEEPSASPLLPIFTNPSLQVVSFTITEKGYALRNSDGDFLPSIQDDIECGPAKSQSLLGQLLFLLQQRFEKGRLPLALLSLDNCADNGDKLRESLVTIAQEWLAKGRVSSDFVDYLQDKNCVAFPLSMIDKITPQASDPIKQKLDSAGLEGMDIVVTANKARLAPFVNTEDVGYLVIEDNFPNGRPPLEETGVIFTERETVKKVETMKVTTCLNPLHTALALTGCLLGYKTIADEMQDPLLTQLVYTIGYDEGLPVVTHPGVLDPKNFIDEVLQERFPNPYIPDTPQRIATDTSQKIAIRFGETIKAYAENPSLKVDELIGIPLVLAIWLRYLMGVDDEGLAFELSPDPMMDFLRKNIDGIQLGNTQVNIKNLLERTDVFGVDLYKVGLAGKIEAFFLEMMASKGSVRKTLEKHLSERKNRERK